MFFCRELRESEEKAKLPALMNVYLKKIIISLIGFATILVTGLLLSAVVEPYFINIIVKIFLK